MYAGTIHVSRRTCLTFAQSASCERWKRLLSYENPRGEVSERLKELASKASVGETLPWVRIPPSPPLYRGPGKPGFRQRSPAALTPATGSSSNPTLSAILRSPEDRLISSSRTDCITAAAVADSAAAARQAVVPAGYHCADRATSLLGPRVIFHAALPPIAQELTNPFALARRNPTIPVASVPAGQRDGCSCQGIFIRAIDSFVALCPSPLPQQPAGMQPRNSVGLAGMPDRVTSPLPGKQIPEPWQSPRSGPRWTCN
jgi:hypothetical protein